MEFVRGSEWRKWDLHLHTASSYDYEYKGKDADQILCDSLQKNNISAAVITDHFRIDAKRIDNLRSIAPEIVFFPGVELRTDKGSNNLHVILIFPETTDINLLATDFDAIMFRQKAKAKEKDETIYWDYNDIVNFAKENNGLISLHAGKKNNGIDKEIPNGDLFKEAIKEEIASTVSFFEIGNPNKDIQSYRNFVFKSIKEKPLVIGSDCHNPKDYSPKEFCWIKADLTFEGLKQCVFQPRERVFIGHVPPTVDRMNKNKTGIIDRVEVKRIEQPKNATANWFDLSIPLNSSMVAVIGNKGSGKSAFSDIIGHLCNCKTMGHASFLNEKRFRKLPKNYSTDYSASITWLDGKVSSRGLGEGVIDSFEEAQYLPQQFIEEVCNDIGTFFQDEIDKVIFSYVDRIERGNATNLSELIKQKSNALNAELISLQANIREINETIIALEKKKTKEYRQRIEVALAQKKELLSRHEKNKPAEVKKPESKEDDKEYNEKLQTINGKIAEINSQIACAEERISQINTQLAEIDEILVEIAAIKRDIDLVNNRIANFRSIYHLEDELDFLYQSPEDAITKIVASLGEEKERLRIQIEGDKPNTGLKSALEKLIGEKEELISNANVEERHYQKYLLDLDEWEKTKSQIIGMDSDEESLSFFEKEARYLSETLDKDYENAKQIRYGLFNQVFGLKQKKISVLESIYSPVEEEIEKLLGDLEDHVEFQAEIRLNDKEFIEKILNNINLKMAGIFKGKTESYSDLEQMLKKTEFEKPESVRELIESILKVVDNDIDVSEKKVTDKAQLYNYLFELDYIDVSFKLIMANRGLEELSPGERGIVLLIFYLALNKNDSPIIIDQPEDNLDNQSVFSKLVPCICKAKQRRQVIIVTHNPNIAVACDAEQIVYCEMDKDNYQHISYITGSIENESIRKHVIDVLEGTMPAFDLRKQKYDENAVTLSR